MNSKNLWFLLAIVLMGSASGLAQTNPDETQGLKPYDSWHGGDLDSVSLTNGGLVLHIPLLSYPQRGSLGLDFSLTYSNKQWTAMTKCVPNGQGGQTCTSKWEPLPRGGRFPIANNPGNNYQLTGAFIASSSDWWIQRSADISTPEFSGNAMSPDGNVHQFGTTYFSGGCSIPCAPWMPPACYNWTPAPWFCQMGHGSPMAKVE